MNKVSLDKIIKKVVYPRYPFIVDHEISVYTDGGDSSWGIKPSTRYTIDLYVGKKKIEGVDMDEILKTMDKARKMVKELFEALGPDENEQLFVSYSLDENRN